MPLSAWPTHNSPSVVWRPSSMASCRAVNSQRTSTRGTSPTTPTRSLKYYSAVGIRTVLEAIYSGILCFTSSSGRLSSTMCSWMASLPGSASVKEPTAWPAPTPAPPSRPSHRNTTQSSINSMETRCHAKRARNLSSLIWHTLSMESITICPHITGWPAGLISMTKREVYAKARSNR